MVVSFHDSGSLLFFQMSFNAVSRYCKDFEGNFQTMFALMDELSLLT